MFKKDNNQDVFENAAKILYGDKRKEEEEEKQERNLLLRELKEDLTPAQILYSSNKDLKEIKQRKINNLNQFENQNSLAPQNTIDPEFQESFAPKTKGMATGFGVSVPNKEVKLLDKIPNEKKTQTLDNQPKFPHSNTPPLPTAKQANPTPVISAPSYRKPKPYYTSAPTEMLKAGLSFDEIIDKPAVNHTTQNKEDKKNIQNINSITKNESTTAKEVWKNDKVFIKELEHVLEAEGGFSDDIDDRGGRTNYGITQDTYNYYNKKHGIPAKDVKNITKSEVAQIYYEDYWLASGANKIQDKNVQRMHMDAAVNHGVGRAKQFYREVGDDIDAYSARRRQYYKDIVKNRPNQQKFYKGWMNRMDKLDRERI